MKNYILISILILLASCKPNDKPENEVQPVDQVTIAKHIERLASDDFMGRMPFTEGEEKTTKYLKSEFEKLGLSPVNGIVIFKKYLWWRLRGHHQKK